MLIKIFISGRTGRSNNKGTSYTFFTPSNAGKVDELINILNETNQYINPELYQIKKYNSKGGGNNRRGGGGNRFGGKSGYGNKSGGYGQGGYNKGASGSGYGRSNYENGGGFKSAGYGNGAGPSTNTRSHTRFDDRGGYSNGSRFQ